MGAARSDKGRRVASANWEGRERDRPGLVGGLD